jgi:hypothetical protein
MQSHATTYTKMHGVVHWYSVLMDGVNPMDYGLPTTGVLVCLALPNSAGLHVSTAPLTCASSSMHAHLTAVLKCNQAP